MIFPDLSVPAAAPLLETVANRMVAIVFTAVGVVNRLMKRLFTVSSAGDSRRVSGVANSVS
jgi:hypothetical protein